MAIDLTMMKKRLEEKRTELQQRIAQLTKANTPPEDPMDALAGAVEKEDQALDLEEAELEQTILANERALLEEVQQALARIENGTYGICTNCGQPIPQKRLEVLPWASLCIACETK